MMSLCTVLLLVLFKGTRNLTTLSLVPLICIAILKTAQLQWKGGEYSIDLFLKSSPYSC